MDDLLKIAGMIDHTLLHPTATSDDLKRECDISRKYKFASLCVKPYMVEETATLLSGSGVKVCCVIGFPSGNSSILSKVYEANDACINGAHEVDMVINVGKALEGDWAYIEKEIGEIAEACHDNGAELKVIIETDYVNKEDDIIKLCEICTKVGADYVKTSTGFGYHKNEEGNLYYIGATVDHIKLIKASIGPNVKIKASGGIRTIEQAKALVQAGAGRLGTSAGVSIAEQITAE